MILFIKAFVYAMFHWSPIQLTVVRRYVDAQKNFIGELYEGEGRTAKMIGVTCDNLPFDIEQLYLIRRPRLCWRREFTEFLPLDTIRVGALEPENNEQVRQYVARRRFCAIRYAVLNRFVEHVMEKDIAR